MSNLQQALYDAESLFNAATDNGDSGRNQIKTIIRRLIANSPSSWVQDNIVNGFEKNTGRALSKTIDYTNRNQLHHVCNVLLDIELGHQCQEYGDGFREYHDLQLSSWMRSYADTSICNNKIRGKGKSRGWHKNCPDRDELLSRTKTILDQLRKAKATNGASIMVETTQEYTTPDVAKLVYAIADEHGIPFETDRVEPMAKHCIEQLGDRVSSSVSVASVTSSCIIMHQAGNDLSPSERAEALKLASEVPEVPITAAPTSAPVATPVDIVDPSMLPAVNALLKQAVGNTTIEEMIEKIKQSNERIEALDDELTELRNASVAVATSGETEVDGDTLKYEVVYRNASELFLDPNGNEVDILKFKIPTLVWFDSDGKAVSHPDCPRIDNEYQFRLKHLIKALTAFVKGKNVWAHGHTSSGKTTLFEQIAARVGFPIEVLNLDGQIERADMVGHTEIVVENGAPTTQFREGILPRAMQKPCFFILDEIDAGRPDALFVVQRALEGKGLAVTEDGGRHVKPHDLFRFCATANSRGQGDEHGWYQGVRPMNLSLLNRFGAFIEVPYLDFDDELRLLTKKFPKIKAKIASQMAQFCKDIQKAFTSGELSTTLAPRNLHAMADYYAFFTQNGMDSEQAMTEALEMCVIDGCPADNQQRIREIANRILKV